MQSILAPKKLKGRRRLTHVFGRPLKKPIWVRTKEKYPDVAGIYRAQLRARGTGSGIRGTGRGRKFYVDIRKFKAQLARRSGNVGKLAAGWSAAAQALDVPVQQWIRRHPASGGTVKIAQVADGGMRITVTNLAPNLPPNLRSELARRIYYAMQYQLAAMERGINAYHERIKREQGIQGRNRLAA